MYLLFLQQVKVKYKSRDMPSVQSSAIYSFDRFVLFKLFIHPFVHSLLLTLHTFVPSFLNQLFPLHLFFIHLLTHPSIYSFSPSLVQFTVYFIQFFNSFLNQLLPFLTHSASFQSSLQSICSVIHPSTHLFLYSSIYSFHPTIHPSVRSFINIFLSSLIDRFIHYVIYPASLPSYL